MARFKSEMNSVDDLKVFFLYSRTKEARRGAITAPPPCSPTSQRMIDAMFLQLWNFFTCFVK